MFDMIYNKRGSQYQCKGNALRMITTLLLRVGTAGVATPQPGPLMLKTSINESIDENR